MKLWPKLALLLATTTSVANAAPQVISFSCYQEDMSLGFHGDLVIPESLWNGTMTVEEFRASETSATRPTFQDLVFTSPGYSEPPVTMLAPSSLAETSGDIMIGLAHTSDADLDYYYSTDLVFESAYEVRNGHVFFSTNLDAFIYENDEGSESNYSVDCTINQ